MNEHRLMADSLEGRRVAVTGAGGGIGQCLVESFLEAGATVAALDLREDTLADLQARSIENRTVSASERPEARLVTLTCDVADEDQCARAASEVRRAMGGVDILVNNAGWFPTADFRSMSYADWRRVVTVNLDSVFLMTKAMLPLIEGRGWGRIINIGSGSVFKGVASQVHYVSAKAGVIGFTRSLARALGNEGITVNLVAPGLTDTPAARVSLGTAALERRRADRAIQRDLVPEDLAGMVLFLSSMASDFITGQVMSVDGGGVMG